jgi:hypothetical protein
VPPHLIQFEAMWASQKIAQCAAWAQPEYAWLYGLGDVNGSFEMTNVLVLWGKVAPIRKDLTVERLRQILDEFHDKGLLFIWEVDGRSYGHWTGSNRPGRLLPFSQRRRYRAAAPQVPKRALKSYLESRLPSTCPRHDAFLRDSMPCPGQEKEKEKEKEELSVRVSPSAQPSLVGFEHFWKLYPRKVDRQRALRAWKKVRTEEYPLVFAAVERAGQSEQWRKDTGQFIPYPSTFLIGRRWEDQISTGTNTMKEVEIPEIEVPT